ncbi:MAG: DUF6340 family protein [Bacteroidales bacterium]
MKKIVFLLNIIGFYILSGCNPTSQISTEILEPGKISIPQKLNSGVLILSKPENDFELVEDEEFPTLIIEEMKYGLADVIKQSPRFQSDEIVIPDNEELKEYLEQDSLNWLDMKKIADQFDVDAVFVMDGFTLDSSLEDERVYEQGKFYYYVTFTIVSNATWEIFYPYQKLLIDEFNYSEKFIWDALATDRNAALRQLPDYDKAFFEAAYWTGYDYAKRTLPTWVESTRTYYTRGDDAFRDAVELVDENKWTEAIEKWKTNLDHSNIEIASRAAFNIAFAFEMKGDIENAIKWAERSFNIKNKERTAEYLEILKERKEMIDELDEQI